MGGAKRQLQQLEVQELSAVQQRVDFQSLSASALPVQRSLGPINISLEEYQFLNEKLSQFRAHKAARAQLAQATTRPSPPLQVDPVAGGIGASVELETLAPALSLEVAQPQSNTLESGFAEDIPRRVAKPSAEILALGRCRTSPHRPLELQWCQHQEYLSCTERSA